MNFKLRTGRGQALILIVLGMVALIAITALAIDGGNVFLNRRSAQNAADTAALAGALAKVKNQNWSAAAFARALSNNFNNDGTSNTVTVNSPPLAGCNGTVLNPLDPTDPTDTASNYIQVIIRTTVNTFFAPVVGINQLHNCVQAIARGKPGEPVSLCYGALICALSPTDKNALRTYGGADVTLVGAGAFSNSNDSQAIYVAKNESLKIQSPFGVTAIGGINVPSGYPSPVTPYTTLPPMSYPLPDIMIPKYTCDYTLNDLPNDLPGHLPYLVSGVYCVKGYFNKAAYRNGTTDGKNIGGVTIVMLNQGLSWAGNADIILNAPPNCNQIPKPPDLFCNSPHPTPPTAGLLIYLPYGNQNNSVKFTGSGNLHMTGTILAPDIGSLVQYNGGYDTGVFYSQLVGWKFEFGGNAAGNVNFPPSVYEYPGIPSVELTK